MRQTGDLEDMLARLSPRLGPDTFLFCCEPDAGRAARLSASAIGTFREAEGVTLILRAAEAREEGFADAPAMRCITLSVHSDMDLVGLTAAVSAELAHRGIPCNMLAGFHHDHLFVPAPQADEALRALEALSARHGRGR